ncbi:unnamed protein product [Urochloa humidicola]
MPYSVAATHAPPCHTPSLPSLLVSLAVSAFFSHILLLNWTWTGATSEAWERAAMPVIRAVTGEVEAKMRIVDRDLCATSDGARVKATLKASTAQRARERPAGVAVDMHNAQQLLEKMLPRIRWDLIAARDQNIHDVSKYVEHLQTAKFAKANKVKLKFLLPRLRYRVPL